MGINMGTYKLAEYNIPDSDGFEYMEDSIITAQCGPRIEWLRKHDAHKYQIKKYIASDAGFYFVEKAVIYVEFTDRHLEILYKLTWHDNGNDNKTG